MKSCIEQIFSAASSTKRANSSPPSMRRIRGSNGIGVTTLQSHAVVSETAWRGLQRIDNSDSLRASSTRSAAGSEASHDMHGSNQIWSFIRD